MDILVLLFFCWLIFFSFFRFLQQQGRANDLSKDYVQAKEDGKNLVSPHWLRACAQSRERVKEKEYPITYNPRMSLDVMTSSSPAVVKSTEKQAFPSNVCTVLCCTLNKLKSILHECTNLLPIWQFEHEQIHH